MRRILVYTTGYTESIGASGPQCEIWLTSWLSHKTSAGNSRFEFKGEIHSVGDDAKSKLPNRLADEIAGRTVSAARVAAT